MNTDQITTNPTDRLDALLKDYLLRTTNYAIMLTASWGAGKTFYLKNHFFQTIKDTGYKPVLISLFGVKTIDDVKDRLFIELYPIVDNKFAKATGSILKAIIKSADVSKIVGNGLLSSAVDNSETALKEISKIRTDFIKLDKLLICFDDLERVNPDLLTDNQILGYINSMVENSNIKVVIVANKGKISSEVFENVKEKTVGNIIYFQQDFHQTFELMLKGLPLATPTYITHLKDNEDIIKDFLIKENEEAINFRTLSYFLNFYDKICHFVQKGLGVAELDAKRPQILLCLLKFSLMVCVEYKKGKLDYLDKQGIQDGNDYKIKKMYGAKDPATASYGEQLIDKFFPNDDYTYYGSVFDYLTGGEYFDESKLFSELCQEYNVVNQQISPAYKIFQQLSGHNNLAELTDKDYKEATRKLKFFALSGAFDIKDYISVFYFINRNGNILNINPQKLTKKFIGVIRKKGATHVYDILIDKYTVTPEDSPYYICYQQISKVILEVNEQARKRSIQFIDKDIETTLSKNFEKLYDRMIKDIQTPYKRATFSGINPTKFFQIFDKAENSTKAKILNLFRVIYAPSAGNSEKEDYEFLNNLDEVFDSKLSKRKLKNVSGSLMEALQGEVKRCLKSRAYLKDLAMHMPS